MPIFEFRCRECEGQFEALLPSVAAAAHATCPGCGASEPRRLMSVIAGMGGRVAGRAGSSMPAPAPT